MQVFVDESERTGAYIMCAVQVWPQNFAAVRQDMRELRKKGQRRVHMTKEGPRRRRAILCQVAGAPVVADIYISGKPATAARHEILSQMVVDLGGTRASLLVLEAMEGQEERDRTSVRLAQQDGYGPPGMTYEHMRAAEEPLLWIADAVAWAYGAGGEWRKRITGTLGKVADLRK